MAEHYIEHKTTAVSLTRGNLSIADSKTLKYSVKFY